MKIHYVIATYLGPRRIDPMPHDPLCHVKLHLKFLKKYPNVVHKSTIVCNQYDPILEEQLITLTQNTNTELILRENKGCSYAAWEQAVIQNLFQNFDYHFLIEDDYIPLDQNFLQPYLYKSGPNIAYTCSLAKNFPTQRHAGISNGLLSNQLAEEIYKNNHALFHLKTKNTPELQKRFKNTHKEYGICEYNQVFFLDPFTNEGYKINHVADVSKIYNQCLSIAQKIPTPGNVGLGFNVLGTKQGYTSNVPDSLFLAHHKLS